MRVQKSLCILNRPDISILQFVRSINGDVNLSNELENKLVFPESQLHKGDHSDVAENGGRKKIESGILDNHIPQEVENISYSQSERNDISFSSEDYSVMEWPYSCGNNSRSPLLEQTSSPDFSDGSISDDEESLIELEIPSGIYVASPTQTQNGKQEEDKEFISKLSSFHQFNEPMFGFFGTETKTMFKQQSILDLLREINEMSIEEENLIEIDIAMGSIKCPRFEIEA
ncbi:hypothetical protein Leryth_027190 [Lithospermum erythrorhizon]|nr:hypothetical protein Leryth_027190 [Lithospermum erythrorhizon]